MNYLGHFYLAYPDDSLIIGNLLGEYVHGQKAQTQYPEKIWEGVMMHRHIDSYTDQHPASRNIAQYFRDDFHKYAPVMSDIALDYLLATDPSIFPTRMKLHDFAREVYQSLHSNLDYFDPQVMKVVENMSKYDWLTQYRDLEGIAKAFGYIISRATYLSPRPETKRAIEILVESESQLRSQYELLIQDLRAEF